jgi:hypothetical protein
MSFFSNYRAYLRHNPHRYWFKRKLYGWGWTPATWQGFVATALFIVLVVGILVWATQGTDTEEAALESAALPLLFTFVGFHLLVWYTGPSPRWQWGQELSDERDGTGTRW